MNMQQQAENLEVIKNPNEAQYTLETPIQVGGQTISEIMIRKPGTVALSGLSLQDIYRSDVNALCQIIPKCVWPQIFAEAHFCEVAW